MNKQLLALAVSSMVVMPSLVLADKGPVVYGKVNVSLENQDDGDNDTWKLQSNASRLGVKGALDLDFENVKAIYKAEFEMSVDDGDKDGQTFTQRNIYGGFTHAAAGTLIAGKFDTPMKTSQGKVDQFNDLQGDIKNIMAGDNRVSNIIQYSTPTIADVITVNLALIPGEEKGDDADDGVADAISSSLVFDNGSFYAALAYDSEMADKLEADPTGDDKINVFRATGMARISNFELGALVQMAEEDEGDGEDTSYLVSAAVKLDRMKLKAQYGMTEADTTDEELTLMALGADYKLAKNSKAFAYISKVEADVADTEDTTFGIGFEHKFSL